ncbi:hypothetical protein HYV72_00060 [Candidatus Uhrbacteria bacterium]|nr:hypothetical protein [Candidatus Uhrbacteria bacterium]
MHRMDGLQDVEHIERVLFSARDTIKSIGASDTLFDLQVIDSSLLEGDLPRALEIAMAAKEQAEEMHVYDREQSAYLMFSYRYGLARYCLARAILDRKWLQRIRRGAWMTLADMHTFFANEQVTCLLK